MANKEILIRLNAMGDILLTIPTLHEMARRNIEPHLIIHQRWAELSSFLPARVHLYEGFAQLLPLAKKLQKLQPQAVHDLQVKLGSLALLAFLKSSHQSLYKKRSFSEQIDALLKRYPIKLKDTRPIWQKYAETTGHSITEPLADLVLTSEYLNESRALLSSLKLSNNKYIVVHADASKPGKVLPDELLNQIEHLIDLPIVIIGLSNTAIPEKFLDLRNKLSLKQLPGLLKHAALVISSDSGPMHLARAVNAPLVGIFMQTCPSLGFSPVPGPKCLVLSQALPCKPCSLHGQNSICPEGHFNCRKPDLKDFAAQIRIFMEKLQ
jgi:ADP-heptose:LPS heptosyltransferase